jgi:hypothetical protein
VPQRGHSISIADGSMRPRNRRGRGRLYSGVTYAPDSPPSTMKVDAVM